MTMFEDTVIEKVGNNMFNASISALYGFTLAACFVTTNPRQIAEEEQNVNDGSGGNDTFFSEGISSKSNDFCGGKLITLISLDGETIYTRIPVFCDQYGLQIDKGDPEIFDHDVLSSKKDSSR